MPALSSPGYESCSALLLRSSGKILPSSRKRTHKQLTDLEARRFAERVPIRARRSPQENSHRTRRVRKLRRTQSVRVATGSESSCLFFPDGEILRGL